MTKVYDEAAKEKAREYYLANRERIIARVAARYKEKRNEITAYNRQWYAENKEEHLKKQAEYRAKDKDKWLRISRQCNAEYKAKLKAEVIAAYGGACQCCGETIQEFLSAEHVGRWGARHRREQGWKARGASLYLRIKKLGFPKDKFGVLCMNCQIATKDGKPCPHTKIEAQSVLMGVAC